MVNHQKPNRVTQLNFDFPASQRVGARPQSLEKVTGINNEHTDIISAFLNHRRMRNIYVNHPFPGVTLPLLLSQPLLQYQFVVAGSVEIRDASDHFIAVVRVEAPGLLVCRRG